MRPTRLGLGALVMFSLTVLSALSTGNNLLYLLYGAMAGAFVAAAAGAALNLRKLEASVEAPEQTFRGSETPLKVTLRNPRAFSAWAVDVELAGVRARAWRVPARGTATVVLRARLPHRGLNRLEGLTLASVFPFSLFRRRRSLPPAVALALPRLRDIRSPMEARAEAKPSGKPTMRKGVGEELYGLREYGPGDDARSINWKMSARSARPLINEYCSAQDAKVVVRATGGGDEAVEEAASVCRWYIDSGSEVALELPDRRVDFGRGLLHLDKLLREAALSGDGGAPRSVSAPAPAAARPELDETMRRLTLFGAFVVYAAMFLVDEIRPIVLIACSPMLLVAIPVQLKRRALLPDLAWTALSIAMLAYIVAYDWRASGVAVANVHLLLYLLANRVLTPFQEREAGQLFLILFLAFFLVSGLTISLWYFGAFLLWGGFATAWLSLAAGAPAPQWRAWQRPAGAAVAGALAVAALLFTVTPRVEGLRRINPFVAAGIDKLAVKSSNVMGFTENVSLGFFGELKKSSARVLRVTPPAGGGRPPALYVRGSAFDVFDGRRWSKAPTRFATTRHGPRILETRVYARREGDQLVFPAVAPPKGAVGGYELQIYPMMLSVLFTVGTPWVVQGVDSPAWFDHTDSIKLAGPYTGGARYRVFPSEVSGFGREIYDYDRLVRDRYLAIPADPEGRRAALVQKVTKGAPDKAAAVEALARYLRKAYAYSTYSDGKDRGLDDFLFKVKRGNCEYFASAAVVLFRQAGVPARMVTGFLTTDWNQYGRFFDVRQSDAHAWAEVYLPPQGWVTVDATPSQGALGSGADALARRLEKWFEAAQTEWYRRIIGYDLSIQRNTFRRLGEMAASEKLEAAARGLGKLAVAVAAVLGLWSLGGSLLKLRRAPLRRAYERAELMLSRAGLPRRPDLTPREYARDVGSRRPELSSVVELAELEYGERYGGRGPTEDERRQAGRILAELRARL